VESTICPSVQAMRRKFGFRIEDLTARELEVLHLMLEGKGNKEISAATGISGRTAQFHASNLLNKLGLANRRDLLAYALSQLRLPLL